MSEHDKHPRCPPTPLPIPAAYHQARLDWITSLQPETGSHYPMAGQRITYDAEATKAKIESVLTAALTLVLKDDFHEDSNTTYPSP